MQEAGDILRQAREAKGLSIAELHQRTRIREKLIEAMEQGEFSSVPGGMVYVKGFVRNLSAELEIDSDQIMSLLGETSAKVKAPQVSASHRVTTKKRPLMPVVVLLVVLMAIVGIYIRFFHSPGGQIGDLPPQGTAPVSPSPEPSLPEEPAPQTPGDDALPEPGPELDPFVLIIEQEDLYEYEVTEWPMTLVVKVTRDRCWVSGTVDGRVIQGATLARGEERIINAESSLRLRLGLAEVTEITVNGHSLGPQTGYVRDYVFNPASP